MACEVNFDLVPFTHWEKDKEALELSDRLIQLPSGALVISNASETDAGLYRCVVENVGSSKSSDEAPLQTIPETGGERKLEFLVQPASVAKLLGSGVLLPCVVSGYPAPHIRWMFGEKVLEESQLTGNAQQQPSEICKGSNTLLPVLLASEDLSCLCWRLHPKVLMLFCRCYPKSFMGEELDLQTESVHLGDQAVGVAS
ncbi:hypothetical protein ATANTOWER_028001 [Ataeniobius toweri]|uniref:Ig-like domain-containing protein n=1 Tax=Ataeniobius toweri TaxID=208326 RepID=A0ABU7A3S3_9TELE|nr:hypothetical protein [Ataeniobius toweri]